MSNLRIVPVNDFDDATLVATPAMLTTLPETNAQLTARDRVARSSSIADQVIQGHWSTNSRRINCLFIFRHTGFGGKVRLQLWANDNYTTEVFNSGPVDFVGYLPTLEDFEWGVAPLGLRTSDLLVKDAPFCIFFDAVTCASFTLTFTQCQDSYWEFGRIFMGKYTEAPYNPEALDFGLAADFEHKRTRGASIRTRPGDRWREMSAKMYFLSQAERAAWNDLMARLTNRDVAVSVFPGADPPGYATWNPSDKGANVTLSNGDLTATINPTNYHAVRSTIGKRSGKWHWYVKMTSASSNAAIGVANSSQSVSGSSPGTELGGSHNSLVTYPNGNIVKNGAVVGTIASWTQNDSVVISMDLDNGTVGFSKNGGATTTLSGANVPSGVLYAAVGSAGGGGASIVCTANFGATSLLYAAPSNYEDGLFSVTNADGTTMGRWERDHIANMKLVQHAPFSWEAVVATAHTIRFTEV